MRAMQQPDLNGKIFSRSFAKKLFLKKTNKGGMGPDVTNRGGVRGGIPPGIHKYHRQLQKPGQSCFHYLHFGSFLLLGLVKIEWGDEECSRHCPAV